MGFDGFDGVELKMAVEDTFGISIADREAEKLQTAGQLHDYIVKRIGVVPNAADVRCPCAASFYRARRMLRENRPTDVGRLYPSTPVEVLLPEDKRLRKESWRELGRTLGIQLPRLVFSGNFNRVFGCLLPTVAVVGLMICAALAEHSIHASFVVTCLIIMGLVVPTLATVLLRKDLAVYVPQHFSTIGQISGLLMMDEFEQKNSGWTSREVWEVIRWHAAKSAGISPTSIKRETRWIELD